MTTDEVRVRGAVTADHGPIVGLWWQLSADGQTADRRYRIRADAGQAVDDVVGEWLSSTSPHVVLVAEADHVVGFVTVRPAEHHEVVERPPTLLVTDAVVDPSARRLGIGRALVGAVREHARSKHFGSVEVGTLALDARAVAFWRAMGFEDWRVILQTSVVDD